MKYLENNIVYLVAPSFGCFLEPYKTRLDLAIKNFTKLGFKVIKGKNIYLGENKFASTSSLNRAKEIQDAFNSDASLILSVGGGEIENEILPYIDFGSLSSSKKIFMGFSDNTNTSFLLATKSNIKSVYGLTAPSFFKITPLEKMTLDLLLGKIDTISGFDKYIDVSKSDKYKLKKQPYTIKKEIKTINSFTKVKGKLLGGCIDCLLTLCGTSFDNVSNHTNNNGEFIFYLESCDLNPLQLRRGLFQLKNARWFNNVNGFIFGRMQDLNNTESSLNYTYFDAISDSLKELNKPIIYGADLGHVGPSLPMINNADAIVEYKNNNIFIKYLN